MLYVAIASTVVAVSALAYALSKGSPPPPAQTLPVSSSPKISETAKLVNEDTIDGEVVEKSKLAIRGILGVLAASVLAFLDRNDSYSGQLSESREAIANAGSLESIKAIEEELLGNLDKLQQANADYREQLTEAHEQIARQQKDLDRLEVDVGTDFLTGLPNRRVLEMRLRENVDRSNRYGTKFSLVIFDIDLFKHVNDQYGHLTGDRILKAIAALLGEHMRSSDFLARYGGEEFVMILPETDDERAERMSERIRAHVESATFKNGSDVISLTISAGVGEVLQPKDTDDNLFERVDAALYEAKQSGRNKVVCAL